MSSLSGVVLHTGQGMSLEAYVFRVAFHLLAIVGIAVAIHWFVRAIETISSEIGRWGGIDDNEP